MKHLSPSNWFSSARTNSTVWIEPDSYGRYLPVIRWIQSQAKPLNILEVGSGDFGLSTYLSGPIVKIDLKFSRASHPKMPKVGGSAVQLPFKNRSFDLVFSVDLFEHLEPEVRLTALKEMIRVTRKQVFAIFPCGERSRQQDLELAREFKERTNQALDILEAHGSLPFPEASDISGWKKQLAGEIKNWRSQKSFNLTVRKALTRGWLFKTPLAMSFTRFLLNFPGFLTIFDIGPSYRRIVSISVP